MKVPAGQILTELAQAEPERPAVTCGEVTVTRAELESWANRLARVYEDKGVRCGDFVTITLPNSIEFYAATFAVWKLGAIPQPVSSRLPARELATIIELADPRLVVGAGGLARDRGCIAGGFIPDASISDAPLSPARVSPAWKAPTSGGSTGRPKLIVSGNSGAVDPAIGLASGMQADGVQLVAGPLYHNSPFTSSMFGLYLGNHLVVLPKFDPDAALDAIAKHRVDWVVVVPTMMLRILRQIEGGADADLSSLRQVWHMAAPCPAWLKEAWIDLVGPDRLMELYGGTESQALTCISGTEWLKHRGSVGRAVYGEMVILDDSGAELPRGQIGEIFMRTPTGEPPAYRYIGAEARRINGWESLGDLGWMDEDDYLYLSDRRTDLIISGGANIYPAEVEAVLLQHPQVESAVVVGLPDHDLGQQVHAVVQSSGHVTEAELCGYVAELLVRYKVPRSIRFTATPLRDEAGKVRRSAVRESEIELMRSAQTSP